MTENNQTGNNHKTKAAIAILVLLALGGGAYYWWTRDRVSTDDAFVDGHVFSITPRINGYITKVHVEDNQEVAKGEALVALDRTDYEVALAEAKANLAESESTLTSLELGVPLELTQTSQRVRGAEAELRSLKRTLEMHLKEEEAAVQEIRRSEAEQAKAALDLRRMQGLLRSNAISQSTLDEVETKAATAEAQTRAARAKRESARNQAASVKADMERLKANIDLAATGEDQARIRSRQVEAQKARVELAKARVRQAELDLTYTTIVSPTHGYVTRKRAEPGLMVSKGQPLMAVVPLNAQDLWVTANFKETQLTHVRPGQSVEIRVDTYPGMALKGTVESIMAGTGAAFSLFPPENATGNYVKVVQRVPVKIVFDVPKSKETPPLRIGLSVIPTIFIHSQEAAPQRDARSKTPLHN